MNYKQRQKCLRGAAVTSIKTNLPAFAIEFEDTILFMRKVTRQFFNEFIIFSVHSNRKVFGQMKMNSCWIRYHLHLTTNCFQRLCYQIEITLHKFKVHSVHDPWNCTIQHKQQLIVNALSSYWLRYYFIHKISKPTIIHIPIDQNPSFIQSNSLLWGFHWKKSTLRS